MLRVGIIGAGVFGGYHAQKITASPDARLIGVFDAHAPAAQTVVDASGEGAPYADLQALLADADAMVIATPAVTHEALVAACLDADKHVLVEKPLALTGAAADALAQTAADKDRVLQVGHQERFVFDAMGVLRADETPIRIDAVREAPPSPTGRCEDVSVVFDLMIHDIDLAAALLGRNLTVETAQGRRAQSDHLDVAEAVLRAPDAVARLSSSRCADARKRTMRIEYPSGVVDIDFLARTVENDTAHAIQLDVSAVLPDPLQAADEAFIAACLGRSDTPIPGYVGARAASLAEAIENAAEIVPHAV